MKKLLVLLMIVGLVVGSLTTAEAKKKKKPKTPPPYTMTGAYGNPAIGTAGAGLSLGAPAFTSSDTNVFMSVKVADDASPTPYGDFSWDTDGDGTNDTGVVVCGTEAKDLEVPANTTITAFMWALPSPLCPGFSTSGTIEATFSATPSS